MPRRASGLSDNFISIDSALTENLTDALSAFEKKIQGKVLISGVAAMARVIYDEVKINAEKHRKTGLLVSAVYRVYSPEKSGETRKTYRISVNKGKAPHWHFLEYGTSKEPARPFIRPAFDHMGSAIKAGQARMTEKLDEETGVGSGL